jgi:hypothetical protein
MQLQLLLRLHKLVPSGSGLNFGLTLISVQCFIFVIHLLKTKKFHIFREMLGKGRACHIMMCV